jgi:hypothetical protein
MKQHKYLPIVILLVASIASCKKSFLDDVSNKSQLLRQDYIVDLKTTNEYLNGVYITLASNLFSSYNTIYPELTADNIKPVAGSGTGGQTPLNFHYEWNQRADDKSNNSGSSVSLSSSDFNTNSFSYGAYQIIRSCNFVLEKAEEYRTQSPATADVMKGQAYAIRALTHLMLVNFFAQSYNFTADGSHPGVAYITTSNWTDGVKARNTVAEVYINLISDLNSAISLLPSTSSSTLIMSRNTAKGLLARVYLFKGDWALAKNLSREVGVAVPIMTVNYPAKLFTLSETEALFQLPPGNPIVDQYSTRFAGSLLRSNLQFRATSDIALLLNEDPNDVRKSWVTLVSGNWNIVKFPIDIVSGTFNPDGAYYHSVLRSSEMYLTAAEAYAELNNVDSARFYLDAIRKRANPTAISTISSGTALLEAIYKERRKELGFEGLRMFDLLRWKKGVNRVDALTTTAQTLSYPNNKAIAPIPGLDVKGSGFIQNLDY